MDASWKEWVLQLREYAGELGVWAGSVAPETAKQRIAEERAALVATFESYLEDYAANLPAIESRRFPPRGELFQSERKAIARLLEEFVRGPVLEDFDERLGSWRDR